MNERTKRAVACIYEEAHSSALYDERRWTDLSWLRSLIEETGMSHDEALALAKLAEEEGTFDDD